MSHSFDRIEDFLLDESFQDWVRLGDAAPRAAFWQNWVADHPDRTADVAEARQLLLSLRFRTDTLPTADVDRIKTAIRQATRSDETLVRPLHGSAGGRRWLWAVAASVALAVLAGGYYWQIGRYTRYETAYGEIRTVRLPDGSQVTLNAKSSLKYLDEAKRTVWLEGEAYFDVVHTLDDKQFLVRTKNVTVEVLGTAFNVAERRARTVVTLDRGRIQLDLNEKRQAQPLVMTPGETVSVATSGQTVQKVKSSPAVAGSWTEHRWVLENTTLQEVAEKIELTYGKRVVIRDSSLAREAMTGVLPTRSLPDLLSVLHLTYNVRTDVEGDQITITR